MKKKKMKETEVFSRDNVIKKRKFPKLNTVLLIAILIVQIALILFAVFFTPTADDVIKAMTSAYYLSLTER